MRIAMSHQRTPPTLRHFAGLSVNAVNKEVSKQIATTTQKRKPTKVFKFVALTCAVLPSSPTLSEVFDCLVAMIFASLAQNDATLPVQQQ